MQLTAPENRLGRRPWPTPGRRGKAIQLYKAIRLTLRVCIAAAFHAYSAPIPRFAAREARPAASCIAWEALAALALAVTDERKSKVPVDMCGPDAA